MPKGRRTGFIFDYTVRRDMILNLLRRFNRIWFSAARIHRRLFLAHSTVTVVVGSFGKSTTSRAVATLLTGRTHRYLNNNSGFFVAHALLRSPPWKRHVVVEVGIDRPGVMTIYARLIRPDVVVVTSIGSEHQRSLHTLEATRNEKAEMVRALGPGGVAILNGDDSNVSWMKGQTRAQVITFGFSPHNDVSVRDVILDWPRGMQLTVSAFEQTARFQTRLVGKPAVYALLAAAAVGRQAGYTLPQVADRLAPLSPLAGRLEVVPLDSGAVLIRDEYKASYETIQVALDFLARIPATRRILVIGRVEESIGVETAVYRRLGEISGRSATRIVYLGPRKRKGSFRSGAKTAGLDSDHISYASKPFPDALEKLPAPLTDGDVVMIKGRGSQRLDRLSLALMGYRVTCDLKQCTARVTRCHHCKNLSVVSIPAESDKKDLSSLEE